MAYLVIHCYLYTYALCTLELNEHTGFPVLVKHNNFSRRLVSHVHQVPKCETISLQYHLLLVKLCLAAVSICDMSSSNINSLTSLMPLWIDMGNHNSNIDLHCFIVDVQTSTNNGYHTHFHFLY